ncbi:Peptidoglycan/xylan/chitin deacetylase, PgdA/CDA1 family [Mesobacillus persicus]|uniref:Peptidoglycan/xylan/chitin deacetylase, PgdA/CDA1 family n=1 Tax=Mesobacillus persicus TaxID=930146 RepID=A0A1H8IEW9_9BACI|nr:polysaccharide deacetylase family protein [Mesobacillus persicus]SEN66765.1 Peptidoglycan/xylan/chitin deacetylase, PgdA/CDA1 family [Mesobacillus persicus]
MIDEVVTSQKLVAITFDDGPNPVYTPQVFGIFKEAGGKATFFMIGEQIEKNPEIARQAYELGHEIGNHTYSHPRMSELSQGQRVDEIERTEKLIHHVTGQKPSVFRPPYLDYNSSTALTVSEKGYHAIGALNLEAHDWEQPGVEHILSKSMSCVKNGSILIFHDGFGDRSQTIQAVRLLVSELTSQGFQLVTVSELLKRAELGE